MAKITCEILSNPVRMKKEIRKAEEYKLKEMTKVDNSYVRNP
jgi:hypothetical protein